MSVLMEIRGLKTYFFLPEGIVKAVDGISYDIYDGETVCLVGESGCGKSATALSLMRLIPTPPGKILGGEIIFGGRDLLKLNYELLSCFSTYSRNRGYKINIPLSNCRNKLLKLK